MWPLLLLVGFDLAGFGMVISDIQLRCESYGAPGWMIGAVLSSMFVVQTIASPIWGRAADRGGRKGIVVICTLLSALSMVIYAFAASIPLILISRIVAGLAAANVSSAQAWISRESGEEERVVVMGWIGAAVTAGLVVGPALGGFLAHFGGNRLIGLVAAGSSGWGTLFALGLKEKKIPMEAGQSSASSLSELGRNRSLLGLICLAAVAWFSLACLEGTFARLVEHLWHGDQLSYGIVFAFESLVGFIVQAFLLSKLTKLFSRRQLVVLGLLLQGLGLASMPFMPALGFVFIGAGIYSVGSGIFGPSLNAWCGTITPQESQATMYGTLQSARSFGFVVGPTLGGLIFDRSNRLPYLISGAVCLAVAVLAARIKDQDRPGTADLSRDP